MAVSAAAARLSALAVAASMGGCSTLSGLSGGPTDGGPDAEVEGSVDDAAGDVGPADGAPEVDASEASVPTIYNDITDVSRWSTFDLGLAGFFGGVFDGRYVYFGPTGTTAVRYDTQAAFSVVNSWSTYDLTMLGPAAHGFRGAVFDRRYVYFVPQNTGTAESGFLVRVDTQAAFTSTSSWTTFDTGTLVAADAGPQAKGFIGGAFDGHYVYLVPNAYAPVEEDGLVVRYDPSSPFASATSWSTFNAATVNRLSVGFFGAVSDGTYLYFVNSDCCAAFTRYDTGAPFTTATSWSTFDTRTVNSGPQGFAGGAFDGRYVYLVPNGQGSYNGLVTRYDTTSSFALPGSFQTFDLSTVNLAAKGFVGAAFDGRYVYFVPSNDGTPDGRLVRYDTLGGFASAGSYSTFDTTTLNANAKGFAGAVFDGRYVYLVPGGSGLAVRFDAKSPASMPPGYSGSFL